MAGVESIQALLQQHFYRVRSLQEIAAFNVIGLVCINLEKVDPSCEEVYQILLRFRLPSTVNSFLRPLVLPISKSVRDWRQGQFLKASSGRCNITASQFVAKHGLHWMWCGVVDFDKMAKLIVREKSFGVVGRFNIACTYSISSDACSLFAILPIYNQKSRDGDNKLVKYWKALLNGEVTLLVTDSGIPTEGHYGLIAALELGNLASVTRFWSQLTEYERSANLLSYAVSAFKNTLCTMHYQPCMVPFFLLQINEKHWGRLIRDNLPIFVKIRVAKFVKLIRNLMAWPWLSIIVPIIDAAFSFLEKDKRHYDELQNKLPYFFQDSLDIIGNGNFVDPQVEDIAIYIWQKYSAFQKKQFFTTTGPAFVNSIGVLFTAESHRCFDAVTKDVDFELLKNLAFSDDCIKFVAEQIKRNECKAVELVVQFLLQKDLRELKRFELKVIEKLAKSCEAELNNLSENELVNVDISTSIVNLSKIINDFSRVGRAVCNFVFLPRVGRAVCKVGLCY